MPLRVQGRVISGVWSCFWRGAVGGAVLRRRWSGQRVRGSVQPGGVAGSCRCAWPMLGFVTQAEVADVPELPEALFRSLQIADGAVRHLWAHQADLLRDYCRCRPARQTSRLSCPRAVARRSSAFSSPSTAVVPTAADRISVPEHPARSPGGEQGEQLWDPCRHVDRTAGQLRTRRVPVVQPRPGRRCHDLPRGLQLEPAHRQRPRRRRGGRAEMTCRWLGGRG